MNELIESIKKAEEQAAKIKAEAYEKASAIMAEAAARAGEIARECGEENKRYREELLAEAEKQAEEDYVSETQFARRESKAYAESILKNTDVIVGKIVGRICGGNC